MTANLIAERLERCRLIAILRGLRPDEAVAVATALVDAGIEIIEVPLNSPEPFTSIGRLSSHFGDSILVGAGTVLAAADVERLDAAGGRICVSPNMDPSVIRAAASRGLASLPGFATPSEGFAALAAGADALKLFPAEAYSPAVLRALRAVLPPSAPVLPVGGIRPDDMEGWLKAGAAGFGLGSALFRPGLSPADVGARARAFVDALPGEG